MAMIKRWLQKHSIETYLLIIFCAIFFVYALGFITHFYPMFYEGTSEMYETYLNLQNFNKYIFNAALTFIILAVLTFILGIPKRKTGIINSVYLLGFSIYAISIFREVNYYGNLYKNQYLSHDFSSMEGYVPRTLEFDLGQFLLISICVLAVISFVTSVVKFIRERMQVKEARNSEDAEGVVETYGN